LSDEVNCPKCGRPRQPGALDCPWCGLVYARWRPSPGAATAMPDTAPAAVAETETVYDGPEPELTSTPDTLFDPTQYAPPPRSSAGGSRRATGSPAKSASRGGAATDEDHAPFDTPFTRSMPLSLLVAGLLWLLAQTFFTQNVLNGVQSVDEAYRRFELLTGFEAPPGLQDGAVLTWTGRQIVVLDEAPDDQPTKELELSVWAYHQGRLAGDATRDDLFGVIEALLDRMIRSEGATAAAQKAGVEAVWWRVSEREYTLRARPATLRILAVGAQRGSQRAEGVRIACLAFTAPDGRPAMLAVMGPPARVTRVLRGYLRRLS
jgi:hypothetical protein